MMNHSPIVMTNQGYKAGDEKLELGGGTLERSTR